MTIPTTPSADYASVLRAALEDACLALKQCHDVTEWPADGTTAQDESMRKGLAVLALASPATIGPETAKPRKIATVRVTNKGYAMTLAKYIAYALPEGDHDLYDRPATTQPKRAQEQPSEQAVTYTVDGVVMSPFEYIDHLHDELLKLPTPAAQVSKADASELPKLPALPLAAMLVGPNLESLSLRYTKEQVQEFARAYGQLCRDTMTKYGPVVCFRCLTTPAITEPAPAMQSIGGDPEFLNLMRRYWQSGSTAADAYERLVELVDARPPVAPTATKEAIVQGVPEDKGLSAEVVRRAIDVLDAIEGQHMAAIRCAKLRAAIEAYEAAAPAPQGESK